MKVQNTIIIYHLSLHYLYCYLIIYVEFGLGRSRYLHVYTVQKLYNYSCLVLSTTLLLSFTYNSLYDHTAFF